jgi:hypothetical protein
MPDVDEALLKDLHSFFGDLRAEYFEDEIFDLFTQPAYWHDLLGVRPCLLMGGRGTGKTTALRSLSYEGQYRLAGREIADWAFLGLYWRLDTSTVTAFQGMGVSDERWIRLFSHYVNLQMVQMICDHIEWRRDILQEETTVDPRGLRLVGLALHLGEIKDVPSLAEAIEESLIRFEAFINNADSPPPQLSLLGRPVQLMATALRSDRALADKSLVFLIDEYENCLDYQQRVLNTLIKHAASRGFTLKVGVKEAGLRQRATLNENEVLSDPADYALISITERLLSDKASFDTFARDVCNGRLGRMRQSALQVEELLPGLSEAGEADLLGVAERIASLEQELTRAGTPAEKIAQIHSMDTLSAYMISYWARSQRLPLDKVLEEALAAPERWRGRLVNHQHAMLFTIRAGKSGTRKYYSGWDTFVHLANGNIRFLLQLVTEALNMHVTAGRSLNQAIEARVQSLAANQVGGRIFQQLQGVASEGVQLSHAVLGLGRILQVMAAQPEGHTPEVNQFSVDLSQASDDSTAEQATKLLNAGVMHLAFVRFFGNKMARDSGETKADDYMLHPIFAPFFVFSYRRKRNFNLTPDELLGLVHEPKRTIEQVLGRSRRRVEDLPDQLALFSKYYEQ